MNDADKSKAAKQRWLEGTYGKAAKKPGAVRRPKFETTSAIPEEPVYVAADVKPGLEDRLGLPGEYPFTRGVQPNMYRGRLATRTTRAPAARWARSASRSTRSRTWASSSTASRSARCPRR